MMEEKKSQQVFIQMKDDTSSLIVLCDSDSFATKRTNTTTATSKLSLTSLSMQNCYSTRRTNALCDLS